jgi:hypothetical protein
MAHDHRGDGPRDEHARQSDWKGAIAGGSKKQGHSQEQRQFEDKPA